MLQIHLSDQQFYWLLSCVLYQRSYGTLVLMTTRYWLVLVLLCGQSGSIVTSFESTALDFFHHLWKEWFKDFYHFTLFDLFVENNGHWYVKLTQKKDYIKAYRATLSQSGCMSKYELQYICKHVYTHICIYPFSSIFLSEHLSLGHAPHRHSYFSQVCGVKPSCNPLLT